MQTLEFKVTFTTPAFLGNAEQQGQWRTPPFKALIRQWWRVVHAPRVRFDVDALRRDEGVLFGTAADGEDGSSQRSLMRIRLKHWSDGDLGNDKWPRREMRDIGLGKNNVPADVYLGFGPILPASKRHSRPNPVVARRAIAPGGEGNILTIGFDSRVPKEQIDEVRLAMRLATWFGALGSRSRNGWGSVIFAPTTGDVETTSSTPVFDGDSSRVLRPLRECFTLDWPHAVAADARGPLVWVGTSDGKGLSAWKDAVMFLAALRRDIRASAKAIGGGADISANQLIAYPITNSNNTKWGGDSRLAGSLRFKVLKVDGGLLPVVVHLPAAIPNALMKKLSTTDQKWVSDNQLSVWEAAHAAVDRAMLRSECGK